ncbi:hypothetical protein MNV49_004511 [Pseudohyphozyma bogoriensis]|nr:hypothetical protein MNV49_004511 [Pseudohyphozyma bogoriensis]
MPKKGSKRRKTRTHVKPTEANADPNAPKVPKSFVVKSGVVGNDVAALTRDVRKVLEPNTGSRIRERKSNRLRDFVSMSGPLGVTHLLVFSQPSASSLPVASSSETAQEKEAREKKLAETVTTVNLRLIRLPRGPTLSFKVLRYSLAQDVLRIARRPRSIGREFAEGPLLILSGFGGEDKQLKLMTTVFQNLFPPIHVQTMPLSSARRVVLLSYNPVTRTIEFRHYLISVRPVGVSRAVRKIVAGSTLNKAAALRGAAGKKRAREDESEEESEEGEGKIVPAPGKGKGVLDLGRAEDVSDYILRRTELGFITSDSEASDSGMSSGGEGSDSENDERRGKVRLGGDYVGRGNRGKSVRGEKRAVRLVELGPRMELGLVKIEEGVGEGEVMFHEMVHKSVREAADLAKVHAARRKLQAERREEQARNVAAKKAAKKAAQDAKDGKTGEEGAEGEEEEDEEEDSDAIDSDIDFDYEAEHGLPADSDGAEGIDEELEGSDDEEDEDDDEEEEEDQDVEMNSSAGESEDDDEEEIIDPEYSDSDTSPVPVSMYEAPPLAKGLRKPSAKGPASFKHKGFTKQERAPAKRAIGIQLPRGATKKEKKREAERERKEGKQTGNREDKKEEQKEREGKKGSWSKEGGFERGRGGGDRGRGGRGGRGGKK